MIIKWKQQHINNACAPTCITMLLTKHNIQKEDFEIIYESKRPYLVEYSKENKVFYAGVLMQNTEIMNIVPNKFDLEYVYNEFDDFKKYLIYAKILLENGIAFMTGVSQGFIPAYDYKQDKNTRGHALVVHKIKNERFYFLDPDGGINREKENQYKEVKKLVAYNIHINEVKKILEARPAKKFVIGHLKKMERKKINILDILNKSKRTLESYSQVFKEQAIFILSKNGTTSYEKFYDLIIRMIKPFALDLKNALKTIPNPTSQELILIKQLEDLFQYTLIIQKKLKENSKLKVSGFFKNLFKQVEKIQSVSILVLNEEIIKYH